MKSYLNQDVYVGVIMMIVSLFLVFLSMEVILEARLFPLIFLIIMIIFSILIIFKGINRKEFNGDDDEEELSASLLRKPIILFGGITLYCLLITLLGFFPSTILFLVSFLYINKYKNHTEVLLTTVLTIVFVYFVFVYQLNVALPSGYLFGN